MTPPPPRSDPGPLKKLEEQLNKLARREIGRMRQLTAAAEAAVKRARPWPAGKLGAITAQTQKRLDVLYSPGTTSEILQEKSRRGLMVAEQEKPRDVEKKIEGIKEEEWLIHGRVMTDAEARAKAIEMDLFADLVPNEEVNILRDRGLAGAPVELDRSNSGSWSPNPDQAVGAIMPDKPGVYVFAVTYAALTSTPAYLIVERRPDGSANVLSGDFSPTAMPDIQSAITVPVLERNPSNSGSRSVLVYPLNPPAAGKH